MEKFPQHAFWSLSAHWMAIHGTFDEAFVQEGDGREKLVNVLTMLKKFCDDLWLKTSSKMLDYKLKNPPKSRGEMDLLWMAVHSELEGRLFFQVEPSRSEFFDRDDLISTTARAKFPRAAQQLREAGNAFTVSLDSACVFYCMRALEYGLRALAEDVEVAVDGKNWQNILDQINKKIKELGESLPSGPKKNERLQFLSDAAAEFRHFKDAWRNYASHNKVDYDKSQAKRVLDHVGSFIETLANNLQESS